jgi:hypothetical protein
MDLKRSWIRVSVRVDWRFVLALVVLGVLSWLVFRQHRAAGVQRHRWLNYFLIIPPSSIAQSPTCYHRGRKVSR